MKLHTFLGNLRDSHKESVDDMAAGLGVKPSTLKVVERYSRPFPEKWYPLFKKNYGLDANAMNLLHACAERKAVMEDICWDKVSHSGPCGYTDYMLTVGTYEIIAVRNDTSGNGSVNIFDTHNGMMLLTRVGVCDSELAQLLVDTVERNGGHVPMKEDV